MTRDPGERFAAHVGVRMVDAGDGSPCGCWASAELDGSRTWLAAAGDHDGDEVPTGAVLALVDAAARAAAEAALAGPGRRTTLVATATGVQHRIAATGTVAARASVPCEGVLADRADDRGVLRFSVAVDVVDAHGARVATGTVQWLATITHDAAAGTGTGRGTDGG